MGRNSKPRKRYQKRTQLEPLQGRSKLCMIEAIFSPFEAMLHHLWSGGEFEVSGAGELMYLQKRSGVLCPVVDTLEVCAEFFDIARKRDPSCPETGPLHRLTQALRGGAVNDVDLDAAIDCVAALRAYSTTQPANALADVARTMEIKCRLESLSV